MKLYNYKKSNTLFVITALLACTVITTASCKSTTTCKKENPYTYENDEPVIETKTITTSLGRFSLSKRPEHTISVYTKQISIVRGISDQTLRDKSDYLLYIRNHLGKTIYCMSNPAEYKKRIGFKGQFYKVVVVTLPTNRKALLVMRNPFFSVRGIYGRYIAFTRSNKLVDITPEVKTTGELHETSFPIKKYFVKDEAKYFIETHTFIGYCALNIMKHFTVDFEGDIETDAVAIKKDEHFPLALDDVYIGKQLAKLNSSIVINLFNEYDDDDKKVVPIKKSSVLTFIGAKLSESGEWMIYLSIDGKKGYVLHYELRFLLGRCE